MKKNVLILSGIAFILLIIIYIWLPSVRAAYIYSKMADSAGLAGKKISINGYTAHYYESISSHGETIILLHGLGGDKTSFIRTSAGLSQHFRVILPDLAGHGDNSRTGYNDFSINGQADFINVFSEKLGLHEFHLGGNSMGGHISAAYALKYPGKVKSLILINSSGITIEGNHAYSGYGAPIGSIDELRTAMSFGYYRVPDISIPEALFMIRKHNRNYNFIINIVIPSIRNCSYFNMAGELHRIKIPALILWGTEDRVISVETGKSFNSRLVNSSLVLIDNASHTPQLEFPDRISSEIAHFILSETKISDHKI